MSQALAHPTVAAVKAMHAEVLAAHGGSAGVDSQVLLEAGVWTPQATRLTEPVFSDPFDVAAAYLFYLCRNHPFVDGNKRTALATCLVFLSENGFLQDEELDIDKWEALTMAVAAGEMGREETTGRVRGMAGRESS